MGQQLVMRQKIQNIHNTQVDKHFLFWKQIDVASTNSYWAFEKRGINMLHEPLGKYKHSFFVLADFCGVMGR